MKCVICINLGMPHIFHRVQRRADKTGKFTVIAFTAGSATTAAPMGGIWRRAMSNIYGILRDFSRGVGAEYFSVR